MNHDKFDAHIDDVLDLSAQLRAQTRRLMEETERLARRPVWLPWAQAGAFVGAAFLVARFVLR